jgi:hypothetical protein
VPTSPRFATSEPYSAEKAERKPNNSFSLLTIKQDQLNDCSMKRHGAICDLNLALVNQSKSEDNSGSGMHSPISAGYKLSEENKSSYSSSFSTSSNDDGNNHLYRSVDHHRCNTATFGNAEEIKTAELEKQDSQFCQTEVASNAPLRTTTVVKSGQIVNSKRQMMLMMNGDITYSCSK